MDHAYIEMLCNNMCCHERKKIKDMMVSQHTLGMMQEHESKLWMHSETRACLNDSRGGYCMSFLLLCMPPRKPVLPPSFWTTAKEIFVGQNVVLFPHHSST